MLIHEPLPIERIMAALSPARRRAVRQALAKLLHDGEHAPLRIPTETVTENRTLAVTCHGCGTTYYQTVQVRVTYQANQHLNVGHVPIRWDVERCGSCTWRKS